MPLETSIPSWLRSRWLRRSLQGILLLLLVIFVGRYLTGQWDRLQEQSVTVNWPVLIFSQLVLTLALALMAVPNWLVLRALNARLPFATVLRFWFLSNIAKYLPGSIWSLPGRMFLYQRAGVPLAQGVVAVFWEALLLLLSALLLTILGWPLFERQVPAALLAGAIILMALGMLAVLVIISSLRLRKRVLTLPMPERLRRHLTREDLWLTLPQFLWLLALYVGCWLLIGVGFGMMVFAISPAFENGWWPQLIGLYMGAWLVGFVIIFTPGGIGPRDLLLGLGLSLLMNDPLPTVATILARILWTLAEIVGVLLTSLFHGIRRTTPTD